MSPDPASPGESPPRSGSGPVPPLLSDASPFPACPVPPPLTPPAKGPFIGSALALTALYVAGLVGIQTVFTVGLMILKQPTTIGPWVMTLMMACAFAVPLTLIPWLTRRPLRDIVRLRLEPASAVPGTVLLTLGGSLIAGEIATITEIIMPMPEFIARTFDELFSTADPFSSFVMLVIAPPLIEETLCRGLVLRSMLRRWKPATAIVVSAVVFGLIHLNPWQFFYATWLGLVLGWAYWRTRSLGLCVMMHALNNGLSWLLMRLDPQVEGLNRKSYIEPPEHLPALVVLAGFGLLVAGAALLLRLPPAASTSPPPTSDPGSAPTAPA